MDRTRLTLVLLVLLVVVLVLGGMLAQYLGAAGGLERAEAAATRAVLGQTAVAVTATAAVIPTFPPPPDVTALTPTASTYDLLLALAQEWPLVVYEPFDRNTRGWGTGAGGARVSGTRAVEEGRYVWDVAAVDDFNWLSTPIVADYPDFYIAVRVERVDQAVGAQNLVYRYIDDDNFYDFGICTDGRSYQVWRQYRDEWTQLIRCTPHPALRPAAANRLAVIAQRDRYLLFANDRYLTTFDDDLLSGGSVGVSVDLAAGRANLLLFDDFELRAPEGEPEARK